ncbi:MAG TPA: hypothetical protein VGH87_14900 [Polyangiaceae bacterium]
MSRALAAALVLIPSVALADDPAPPPPPKPTPVVENAQTKVSFPFLFGVDAALVDPSASTGFVFGWRPELIFAWTRDKRGVGFGPYADAMGSFGTHQIWLGGGATIAAYFGALRLALSGGADVDYLHADPSVSPVFGLFVGAGASDLHGFDIPFGLRVDVRPSVGPLPTTIIVAAQLDIVTAFTLGALFVATLSNILH